MVSELKETKIYQQLKSRRVPEEILGNLSIISQKCTDLLAKVNSCFPHFTNHDISHSYRVADAMFELLPDSVEKYSNAELVIMLYVAIMHDLGMVDNSFDPKTPEELELIRKKHHIRSQKIISDKELFEDDYFLIDGINLRNEIANISRSHNESVEWIAQNIRDHKSIGNDEASPQFISFLLRIADLIDFDNQRTPLIIYKFFKNEFKKDEYKISDEEWSKQISITNFNHVKADKKNKICKIVFDAEVYSASVCRNLFKYFKYIEKELSEISNIKLCDDRYTFHIDPKIEQNIDQNGFMVKPLIQYVDYLSIAHILIGENIYDKKEHALREIIQNAMDAVLLMKEIKNDPCYIPKIKVSANSDTLSIEDNGIGMTQDVIENYFLCIGKSFYNSKDYNYNYKPISHYGIGFLSSYLLSNKIAVKTSSYKNSNKQISLKLTKDDEYVVFSEQTIDIPRHGTTIELSLADVLTVFRSKDALKEYIEEIFVNPNISFTFDDGNQGEQTIQTNIFKQQYNTYLENILLNCDIETNKLEITPCLNFLRNGEYALKNNQYIDVKSNDQKNTDTALLLKSYIEKDEINFLLVKGLSIEQELILDDNASRCDEREIISNRFYEYFELDQFEDKIVIYGESNDFLDIPDEDQIIDAKSKLFLSDGDKKTFYDFATEKMPHCHRFLVEARTKNIISNDKVFSFFRRNILCASPRRIDFGNAFPIVFYLKNVKIGEAEFRIPYCFSNISIKNLKINITDNCHPNLSRSKISDADSKLIGYAVGRAIHLALLDSGEISGKQLTEEEKELLKLFISKYYSEKNIFCK